MRKVLVATTSAHPDPEPSDRYGMMDRQPLHGRLRAYGIGAKRVDAWTVPSERIVTNPFVSA